MDQGKKSPSTAIQTWEQRRVILNPWSAGLQTLVSVDWAALASEYTLSWTYKWGSHGFSEKGHLWFPEAAQSLTSSSCLLPN